MGATETPGRPARDLRFGGREDFLRNDIGPFVSYRRNLLKRGVLKMPDHLGCRSHISYTHTIEDVDLTLDAAKATLAEALGR
jgi:glutamate-1-semialdehyde 2,1-aminomutase